jgi:UDP-4-amino-4,6-dideoxy-N-acetyl-beta-L-altrosamine N-acetyltransferase
MFSWGKTTMRPVEERDLERLREMRNDPSTWRMLRSTEHVTAERQAAWFAGLQKDSNRAYYVVEDANGGLVGMIRTDERDLRNRSIRVGADVVPELRGQGWGRAIYDMLLKWLFDYENMHRVWLCVLDTNVPARALYEKVGFKVEGCYRDAIFRDGRYINEIIMSVIEDDYRAI